MRMMSTSLRREATSSEPIGTEGWVMLGIRCPSCCNLSDSTASFPSNSATCSFNCLPTTRQYIPSLVILYKFSSLLVNATTYMHYLSDLDLSLSLWMLTDWGMNLVLWAPPEKPNQACPSLH
jgi:hypothetical protein